MLKKAVAAMPVHPQSMKSAPWPRAPRGRTRLRGVVDAMVAAHQQLALAAALTINDPLAGRRRSRHSVQLLRADGA